MELSEKMSDDVLEWMKEVEQLEAKNERLQEVARLLIEAKETPAKDTDARVEMTVTQSLMLNDAYIIAKALGGE